MSATCKPLSVPYIIKDTESFMIKGGYGNQVLYHSEWDRNDINSYIETYIRKLENGEKVDDTNLAVKYKSHYDDLFNNKRIYYFEYQKYGQTNVYATTRPIPKSLIQMREKKLKEFIESPQPPEPPPIRFSLNIVDWLFPKCEYCNKRYIRYLFKLHHNSIHLCKRCCWIFDIDSVEKYQIVNKIRERVKKNIDLQSFCNMEIEDNVSMGEKMKAVI